MGSRKCSDLLVWQTSRYLVLLIHADPNQSKMEWYSLTDSGNKMHNCSECHKSFDRSRKLKSHMVTHSRERAFLVSNTRSHLPMLLIWKRTCSPTVEWRFTIAQNVRSLLVKQGRWGGTWSPTLGRKYTNVQNAEIHLVKLDIWNSIYSSTVGKSYTSAHNAIMLLQEQAI